MAPDMYLFEQDGLEDVGGRQDTEDYGHGHGGGQLWVVIIVSVASGNVTWPLGPEWHRRSFVLRRPSRV